MTTVATEMQNLLVAASLIAVAVAKELTPASDELTARKAYAIYGKPWIEALLEAERTMVRRAEELIANRKK